MLPANSTSAPWFATYVKSRHEKKVAAILAGKDIESFVPTHPKTYANSGTAELPLFPGYVFFRLGTRSRLQVMTTPGVFSIVSFGNEPAPIPHSEIENLRRAVDSGFKMQPWPYLSPGQTITIPSGPLVGLQGIVLDEQQQKWLVLSVHLLRRTVAVALDRKNFLEPQRGPPA
jgi:transcription antitermination factor NusG